MAIFNEAYIAEFFGFGKKKKSNDRKHGLITKEEHSKCDSIIITACSKYKYIKKDFNPSGKFGYEDYCNSTRDWIEMGDIYLADDTIYNNGYAGEEERKARGLEPDYKKFIGEYIDSIEKIKSEVSKKISELYDSNIVFDVRGKTGDWVFIIESKKPKEDNGDE